MKAANSGPPSAISRNVLFLVVALTLCVRASAQRVPAQPAASPPSLREVTDETGRKVKLPAEVRRIVSLAPNLTETVYALGAQERLVGVTDYCDYPPEALTKPKVGGAVNPSLEQIVAMKPDVVLAQAYTMNRRETVDALERLGIAVYATNARNIEGVLESTRRLAEVLGEKEKGEALVTGLRARLDELKRRLAGREPKKVLFIVWHEPLVSIGRDTFIADALRWAGAQSAVDVEQDWPRMSLEEVVRLQPEYVIFANSHSEAVARTFGELRERPGWRDLEAVKAGRYAVISDAVNRPAPRLIEAIEHLARQLHPEAFQEKQENGKGKMEKGPS